VAAILLRRTIHGLPTRWTTTRGKMTKLPPLSVSNTFTGSFRKRGSRRMYSGAPRLQSSRVTQMSTGNLRAPVYTLRWVYTQYPSPTGSSESSLAWMDVPISSWALHYRIRHLLITWMSSVSNFGATSAHHGYRRGKLLGGKFQAGIRNANLRPVR